MAASRHLSRPPQQEQRHLLKPLSVSALSNIQGEGTSSSSLGSCCWSDSDVSCSLWYSAVSPMAKLRRPAGISPGGTRLQTPQTAAPITPIVWDGEGGGGTIVTVSSTAARCSRALQQMTGVLLQLMHARCGSGGGRTGRRRFCRPATRCWNGSSPQNLPRSSHLRCGCHTPPPPR